MGKDQARKFGEQTSRILEFMSEGLTDNDGDIPALIPEKYFLMVNFDAL